MAAEPLTSQEVMLERLRRMAESLSTPPEADTPAPLFPTAHDKLKAASSAADTPTHNGSPALFNGDHSVEDSFKSAHIDKLKERKELESVNKNEDNTCKSEKKEWGDEEESQSDGEVMEDEEEGTRDNQQTAESQTPNKPPPSPAISSSAKLPTAAKSPAIETLSKPGVPPISGGVTVKASEGEEEATVTCGDCGGDFADVTSYMAHGCIQSSSNEESVDYSQKQRTSPAKPAERDIPSDAESFDGKIVYNPDGSAYIIEGESDLSDTESLFEGSTKDGVIVDHKGKLNTTAIPSFPQIANAFYIQKNPSFYNAWYSMLPSEKRPRGEAPIMHSYRVFDVRCGHRPDSSAEQHSTSHALDLHTGDVASVPTKPILMCFICKLSFGYTKSFVAHALSEHSMTLLEDERSHLVRKNTSAIIQLVGKNKDPLLSFLEPVSPPQGKADGSKSSAMPHSMFNNKLRKSTPNNTNVSFVHSGSKATPMELKSAEANMVDMTSHDCSDTSSNLTTSRQGNRSSPYSASSLSVTDKPSTAALHSSPVKASYGPDAKSPRESYSASCQSPGTSPPSSQHIKVEQGNTSPNRSPPGANGLGAPPPLVSISSLSAAAQPQGIVIRSGCEDHPNGNITGDDCAKCEVLRRAVPVGPPPPPPHLMMHSRNSCKTLKCPKCNWHYKYQETLEIHMKEKHPDQEAQCIYCITKQAHPRLARGEVYTCGYKPYRCEVCNYSTTTKGNLSIHMQSDKHINNMQELQKAQAGGGSPASAPPHTAPSLLPTHTAASTMESKLPPSSPLPSPASMDSGNPLRSNGNLATSQSPAAPKPSASPAAKPKPSWRCDVCNYETNVARNLRIHMTSEKHTHNMMMLQQNVSSMQRDMQLQLSQMALMGQDPSAAAAAMFMPGAVPPGMPPFPFDPAMMLPQNLAPTHEAPMDLSKEQHESKSMDARNNNDACRLYQCAICDVFSTDTLEALHAHMQADRTKHGNEEHVTVINGTYLCNLCQYKTNLKANFQLHCKTDKHLQRLQLVNHIREGTARCSSSPHEWQIKYMANISNPVQVRCNACSYYTNSIHKLQLHGSTPRHEASVKLFEHLLAAEGELGEHKKYYHCQLCQLSAKTKLGLMEHVKGVQHMSAEHAHFIALKDEGRERDYTLANLFTVNKLNDAPASLRFQEESSLREGGSPEASVRVKVETTPPGVPKDDTTGGEPVAARGRGEMACPLCAVRHADRGSLEAHLCEVHSVTAEGVHRLMGMVQPARPSNGPLHPAKSRAEAEGGKSGAEQEALADMLSLVDDTDPMAEMLENHALKLAEEASMEGISLAEKEPEDQYRCQTCSRTFLNLEQLCTHQNELGHLELKQTPRGPGYLCWKKGCNQYFKTAESLQVHFREIHAKRPGLGAAEKALYKHECTHCSLAFKTPDKLQLHTFLHIIRNATRCAVCGRGFRSIQAMRKHVEGTHLPTMTPAEKQQYARDIAAAAPLGLLGIPGVEPVTGGEGMNFKPPPQSMFALPQMSMAAVLNNHVAAIKTDKATADMPSNGEDDSSQKAEQDSDISKSESYTDESINDEAFATNSYNDSSKKYKCHRCKVAFAKQNLIIQHNRTRLHRKGSCATPEPPSSDAPSLPKPPSSPASSAVRSHAPPAQRPAPVNGSGSQENRPSKCEVCDESFAQRHLLLQHLNSETHLQRLQKLMPQKPSDPFHSDRARVPNGSESPLTKKRKTEEADTLDALSRVQAQSSKENAHHQQRAYKCNICKVAYSQSAALEKHLQSLLHQTRAAKLQELFVSGEVDITQPLIEQPETVAPELTLAAQEQNKAVLREMMALTQQAPLLPPYSQYSFMPGFSLPPLVSLPQSFLPHDFDVKLLQATASKASTPASTPTSRLSTPVPIKDEKDSPPKVSSDDLDVFSCEKCGKMFNSQENLVYHQQHRCFMQASALRARPATHRFLLENIGFECVMHFNENQIKAKKQCKDTADSIRSDEAADAPKTDVNLNEKQSANLQKDDIGSSRVSAIPELEKSTCGKCNKEFSSVWVLKTHQEEVHKAQVPTDIVEQVAKKFREEYDQKITSIQQNGSDVTENEDSMSVAESSKVTTAGIGRPTASDEAAAQLSLAADLATAQAAQLMHMPMFGLLPGMPHIPGVNLPPMLPMYLPPDLLSAQQGLAGVESVAHSQSSAQMSQSPASIAAAAAAAAAAQQKRARTRISDDQLKILRAHFDINNSPSEEQIMKMCEQTGLAAKVIKHWFRNTLFKERQRNKDSPYNFNVPPTTNLNLEEYEKTGTWKNDGRVSVTPTPSPLTKEPPQLNTPRPPSNNPHSNPHPATQGGGNPHSGNPHPSLPLSGTPLMHNPSSTASHTIDHKPNPLLTKSESSRVAETTHAEAVDSRRASVEAKALSSMLPAVPPPIVIAPITSSSPLPIGHPHARSLEAFSGLPGLNPFLSSPPPNSRADIPVSFARSFSTPEKRPAERSAHVSPPSGQPEPQTPGTPGGSATLSFNMSNRRANRTRFTDYQLRILQEYFDQNAYPKDDDLDQLSKLLTLSPRVIVVWFQNARQKARKSYENHPPEGVNDDDTKFSRTPGSNFQCKKCMTVFQRYYELIRHQRNHCYKDEDSKISVSSDNLHYTMEYDSNLSNESESVSETTPQPSTPKDTVAPSIPSDVFKCEKCPASFSRFEQWKEHLALHNFSTSLPSGMPFGLIPTPQALPTFSTSMGHSNPLKTSSSMDDAASLKRKLEEEEDEQNAQKRMRTTILPEQLDYLYQQYQVDCNPSRKQLEQIADHVGLKKRVVQVWFQNTRARERKGQYRAHQQIIHKRCPFCRALFRAKSALESHLATKHPEEMARSQVNVDAIPDEPLDALGEPPSAPNTPTPPIPSLDMAKLMNPFNLPSPLMPPGLFSPQGGLPAPQMNPSMENMKELYEASLKQLMGESGLKLETGMGTSKSSLYPGGKAPSRSEETPLDLSKPVDLSRPMKAEEASTSDEAQRQDRLFDDSRSETFSESTENDGNVSMTDSNPASPTTMGLASPNGQLLPVPPKRFRTQLSQVQVKIMKSIYQYYKTPTMCECELLGREIGLAKRVIQVWFQNARAKEKKAKMQYPNYSPELDIPTPPEVCKLCSFKYSHKYTVQDHLFSRRHIENVKAHIKATDRDLIQEGSKGLWDKPDAMARQLTPPLAAMPHHSTSVQDEMQAPEQKTKDVTAKSEKLSSTPASKDSAAALASSMAAAAAAAQMMQSPFGAGGMNELGSMLPAFMYPGMGGMSGMAGLMGLPPMLPPGMLPPGMGAEMLMYDPATFGTPLAMLQIPQQAIASIQSKLGDEGCVITRYTQDCKSLADLARLVPPVDCRTAAEAMVDVGYICRKCQMVYPEREACLNHQAALCYAGKAAGGDRSIIKLEQIQYECSRCSVRVSTLADLQRHCEGERHKASK